MELIATSVHVVELKLPPVTLAFQDTVPVGVDGVPALVVSVTVAVRVMLVPWTSDAELGETVVVVLLRTVRTEVPELVEWVESPE